ncbi:MAG: pyridoxal phosphate-dependent aminotransferase [Oscillospiraceae bacterium]|nr:pyridoxal phosphate-dependent aminotransferase [Oscillospiraceae bacterium]
MTYNFNEVIDRRGTNSLKYDFAKERGKPHDLLPLWVADMDFQAPREVLDTLVRCAQHGIFGYTETKDDYFNAVRNWFLCNFDFASQSEWLVKTPGVMFAVAAAINTFTQPGDGVLIQQPVYYPFFGCIEDCGRRVVNNALVYENGAYHIDFDDFERKLVQHSVTLFILCSPHNPVGRVWTADELRRLGEICLRHNCLVLSDEIHCDFTCVGYKHTIFGSWDEKLLDNTILCTAPSKTFNLAGLQVANIFIANEDIRKKFIQGIDRTGYSQLNTMGLAAAQSAYEHGADWLAQLRVYLQGNLAFVRDFLQQHLPQIKLVEPQGTYLIWLDCSVLGLAQQQLDELIVNKAKLWLDSGTMFGPEGKGFQRINIACPRAVLAQALTQLKEAIDD